ncbi:MAG: RidA family protein [Bryobacteraceae bacterium]
MTRTIAFLIAAGLGPACCLTAAQKKVVELKGTAKGLPYSSALKVGDTLYVSGTTGVDPKTGKLPGDFEAEVRQCLTNIGALLKEGRMDFQDAVSVQVYLGDMDMFYRINVVYKSFFPEPRPTRTTVGVARLGGGAHIEVTVTARK